MKSDRLLIGILVALFIIAGAILANFVSFNNIEDLIVDQLKQSQLTETQHVAKQIDSHILQLRGDMVTLSKFPLTEISDSAACDGDLDILHERVEGKLDTLLRADKEGNIIQCSSPLFSTYLGLNIKNKDYFTYPETTNEPFIKLERQGRTQEIIVSVPLFETTRYTPYPDFRGNFEGVLLGIVELTNIYNLYFHPISVPEEHFFSLVNLDTQETILKSEAVGEYKELSPHLPELSEVDIITDFEDFGDTIITYADLFVGSETWRLIVFTPLETVSKEIRSVQRTHVFSLGFVIVMIIVVMYFILGLYRSQLEVKQKLHKAKVTLENLGIRIGVETEKYSQADIVLDPKKLYLIKEDEENNAHELFISSLNRGFAGLGIVRDDPRSLKKKYNLKKTSFIWLTKNSVEGIPCETEISTLFELISEFVKKSEKSVVLLDRLDYILNQNKFEDVITTLHELKDLASAHDCIVILSVNPEVVDETKIKAMEQETVDLYGKHLKSKVELADMEMNILKFINEKNVVNKLVSYKDITENFKITKPTTRSKITKLLQLGLVQVDQRGRFKSIKITSTGRRIIG